MFAARKGLARVPGMPIRKMLLLAVVLLALHSQALATWSVIAVDRKTGQVVIASATCVPQAAFATFPAKGLKDVQAIIIPGVGIAAAQANVDRTRRLQKLIADELNRGTDPVRIIEMLKADDSAKSSSCLSLSSSKLFAPYNCSAAGLRYKNLLLR